jgi:uncharacterized protein YybS (DUF2232 family)
LTSDPAGRGPSEKASVRARPEPRTGGVLGAGFAAAFLYSASLAHPLLGLCAAVAPFPLLVVRLRSGLAGGSMATLLAAAVLAAVFSPESALMFLAAWALPVGLIGEAMARGRGLRAGCGWAFGVLAAEILVALFFASPSLEARALGPFDHLRSAAFLEEMRSGGMPAEQVEAWTEQVTAMRSIMAVVYPAAYIIMAGLMVLANAVLLRWYLARRDPGWLEGGEFEGLRWSLGLAVAFVISGLSVAAPALRPAAYNVLLVLAFFFVLQGLAVVAFFANRLAGPPVLRAAVLVLVLVNPWAPQILALLGLFDIWFDFRKWAEPPEPQRG